MNITTSWIPVFSFPYCFTKPLVSLPFVEAHRSVDSVQHLRTGSRWFDPRLCQYSFRGLTIVTATGFIPHFSLSIVSTFVLWESSHWLGKNIVMNTG